MEKKKTLEVLSRDEFFRIYQEQLNVGTEKLKDIVSRLPNNDRAVQYFPAIENLMEQLEMSYRNRFLLFLREDIDKTEYVFWRRGTQIGATLKEKWKGPQQYNNKSSESYA